MRAAIRRDHRYRIFTLALLNHSHSHSAGGRRELKVSNYQIGFVFVVEILDLPFGGGQRLQESREHDGGAE